MAKRTEAAAMKRRKVAALITFPAGTTIQQVEAFLDEWRGDLSKDGNEIVFDEKHRVMSYDPTSDQPTLSRMSRSWPYQRR